MYTFKAVFSTTVKIYIAFLTDYFFFRRRKGVVRRSSLHYGGEMAFIKGVTWKCRCVLSMGRLTRSKSQSEMIPKETCIPNRIK
jgi:hypothetical protein